MIVNDRITAYIQSLDAGNGPLLDSIEGRSVADCVPIIRRGDLRISENTDCSQAPAVDSGGRNGCGLFGFTDEPCDAGKLPDHDD